MVVPVDGGEAEPVGEVMGGAHMSLSPDESMIMDVVAHRTLWVSPLNGDKPRRVFEFDDAESRIDYRKLVSDLALKYPVRIEMRQIGPRDETKMRGGLGPCGLTLCCSSFLKGFHPVTIKMAKNQNLSLNPSKISGMCGRLMCCLAYEDEGGRPAADSRKLQNNSSPMAV